MSKLNRFKDECPVCGNGKNSKDHGGTERCFHCDVCGFVECMFRNDEYTELVDIIKKRLKSFYSYYKKVEKNEKKKN